MSEHRCNPDELIFDGWLGAPGVGQSWHCPDCERAFWRASATAAPQPFDQLDPSVFELSPEDVR